MRDSHGVLNFDDLDAQFFPHLEEHFMFQQSMPLSTDIADNQVVTREQLLDHINRNNRDMNAPYAPPTNILPIQNHNIRTPPLDHSFARNQSMCTQFAPSTSHAFMQHHSLHAPRVNAAQAWSKYQYNTQNDQSEPLQSTNTPSNHQNQLEPHQPPENFLLDPAQTQEAADVADTQTSSRTGNETALVNAATIDFRETTILPPTGDDGLRFDSRAIACTTTDLFFRQSFELAEDDVEEVEQNQRHYVKLFVDALSHDGFQAVPDHLLDTSGQIQILTDEEKEQVDKWVTWQQRGLGKVKTHMVQPNSDAQVECAAWMILDEIIKVHRNGHRLSTMTTDKHSKCSKRIKNALHEIRALAIVRQKLLVGDKTSDFACSPRSYALATQRTHRNNASRLPKDAKDAEDSEQNGNVKSQGPRTAKKNGAVARLYMTGSAVSKRKAVETTSEDATTARSHKKKTCTAAKSPKSKRRSAPAEGHGTLPCQQQTSTETITQHASGFLPMYPGASLDFQQQAFAETTTQPTSAPSPVFTGASFPNQMVPSFMDSLGPLSSMFDPTYGFNETGTGSSINDAPDGIAQTFARSFGINPFENYQAPHNTQHPRRRAEAVNEQSRHTADPRYTYDTESNAVPTQPYQAYGNVPG